jgi:hypothetical protein
MDRPQADWARTETGVGPGGGAAEGARAQPASPRPSARTSAEPMGEGMGGSLSSGEILTPPANLLDRLLELAGVCFEVGDLGFRAGWRAAIRSGLGKMAGDSIRDPIGPCRQEVRSKSTFVDLSVLPLTSEVNPR